MKVKKMSYSNPDELKPNEVNYIQYLYYKLHSELQHSISFIYELAGQDNIQDSENSPKIKPLIIKYLYNGNQIEAVSEDGFIKFRTLIREKVFTYFYDIIKQIPQVKHEEKQNKIYKKIIITDLYAFLPLIIELIIYYSSISEGLYKVCNEFIEQKNIVYSIKTTNEMIINSLYSFKLSIALLNELLNFIKTRKIRDIDTYLITPNKPNVYIYSLNFNLSKFKKIVSSFDIKKDYTTTIIINNYNKYLEDYINKSTATFIKVDLESKIQNFINYIENSLTNYLISTTNIDSNILKRLFKSINNIKNIDHNKLIELLKKIIKSIEIINSKLYYNAAYTKKYIYILNGINIIILLKKFIEYLYTNEYIIIYAYIITIKELNNTDAFITYINFKIYPNYIIYENIETQKQDISIIDDITSFLREQVKLDKQQESNTSVNITVPSKPETINIFIENLKIYVLAFFQEILTDTNVNNYELKKIIYQNNKKFNEILFIKNITSLFKIMKLKISTTLKINKSIIFLLQYIIDLTINFCIILAKIGNINKYLLKGIVNIILLNKLKDYFESDTTITYSDYSYINIRNDISLDDVMNFILDNNLEYDLDSFIQYSNYINQIEIYDNIDNIITIINHQYIYSDDNVTVLSGGNNKYKKTDKQITVIYKKKEYTRVIYICERKKYVKINKTFMLLSKLKKI